MAARGSADDLVGVILDGRYRVLEHLADGGMASVYLGLDTRLDRDVAIKVMRPDLAADETFVSRFRREARSAARLAHPNVVAVHDQGEADGRVFLVMELVLGQTLRQVLDDEGALSPRAALDLLEPVLAGLAAAHDAGLVHRDVKPENVIIREDGTVKVADFGLARAVTSQTATGATGVLLGTVSYLSPEQVERGIADARSDVYAVGLVLFEMLTGRKAIDGETPIHVAFQHVHGDAPSLRETAPELPDALDHLVAAAISRDPDERPRDAARYLDLVRETRRSLTEADLDARPELDSPRARVAGAERTTALPAAGSTGATQATRTSPTTSTSVAPEPEGTSRRRRSPLLWLLPLLLVLGAVGAGVWGVTLAQQTVVPEVAGQQVAAAETRLTQAELTMSTKEAFDEEVAKGVAIRSTPDAGQEVRKGSEVVVTVSKGPERYDVPRLSGLTADQAKSTLEKNHLRLGQTSEAYDEKVAAGQIIRSTPAAGSPQKRDTQVAVVVSKGPEPIEIPTVTGDPFEGAKNRLEKAGFTVARGEDRYHDDIAQGSVISQDPRDGTGHRGDTVTLVVSKGPETIEVPDVGGMTSAQARKVLEDAGFQVTVERVFGGLLDNVRAVDPGVGTSVPKKDARVTIYVV